MLPWQIGPKPTPIARRAHRWLYVMGCNKGKRDPAGKHSRRRVGSKPAAHVGRLVVTGVSSGNVSDVLAVTAAKSGPLAVRNLRRADSDVMPAGARRTGTQWLHLRGQVGTIGSLLGNPSSGAPPRQTLT